MTSNKPKILVILGPTASGKSDLAVQIAKKFNGEVISADSRQVYKGLDIGTGKITPPEMSKIPHHLIDMVSPKKQFSVSDFIHYTSSAIAKMSTAGKLPIICGGTGLYIDSLLGKINIPEVPPNPKLRARLEKKSAAELFEILQKLDPRRAREIDKNNPRRLVRAIEIVQALGKVPELQAPSSKLDVLQIGIKVEPEELKKRINKRIDKWFKQGLIKEVENLHKKGLSWKRMGQIGLEYRLVAQYLKKEISKPELRSRMQRETYQYAKRQMTWFKRDPSIIWLSPKISLIEKEVKDFLK